MRQYVGFLSPLFLSHVPPHRKHLSICIDQEYMPDAEARQEENEQNADAALGAEFPSPPDPFCTLIHRNGHLAPVD
jgi:hypothetical protein